MLKEQQDNRSKDNIETIKEQMRMRQHGATLGMKINAHLAKVGKKNVVSHIGDSFFEPCEELGTVFQLRRTNLQRDNGRTLNIEDEIEREATEERKRQEEEEKKDLSYDDFLKQFEGHIDGTAANEREAHDSADEGADNPAKSQARKSTISRKES